MSKPQRLVNKMARALPRALIKLSLRAAALVPASMKLPLFERVCSTLTHIILAGSAELILAGSVELSKRHGRFIKAPVQPPITKTPPVRYLLSERETLALVSELSLACTHFEDVGANDGIFTFS
jgi:hypothetical protein